MAASTCTRTTSAALSIEGDRFFQSLEFAFSNSDSYIGELLQNARRAHASEVRLSLVADEDDVLTLEVADDGVGIRDFSTLLRVGRSDWDRETMDADSPYGLGFLGTLYACRNVSVTSHGMHMRSDTARLIKGAAVTITEVSEPAWGTTQVRLQGLRRPLGNVEKAIRSYAAGFPLPVFLNDTEIERPDALTTYPERFIATPIGQMRIDGITHATEQDPVSVVSGGFTLYLQGQPILLSLRSRCSRGIVIHLDSRMFQGRWPDRSVLHDEAQALHTCSEAVRDVAVAFLRQQRERLGEAAFVARYWASMSGWKSAGAIFRECSQLHPAMLCKPQYPCTSQEWMYDQPHLRMNGGGVDGLAGGCIDRDDLDAGRIVLVDLGGEYDAEVNARSWMAAFAGEAVFAVLDSRLLPDWARDRLVREEDLAVMVDGPTRTTRFSHDFVHESVVLCERYRIVMVGTGTTIATVTHDAGYLPVHVGPDTSDADAVIVCPAGESSGQVVGQVCDFVVNDDYDERGAEGEAAAFSRFLLSERGDVCEALQEILRDSQAYGLDRLFGTRFSVAFDDRGAVSVQRLDDAKGA
jgi:hypothetical protein